MNTLDPIEFRRIEAEVRALRAAEVRRLTLAFGAWLRRVVARRPVAHTV